MSKVPELTKKNSRTSSNSKGGSVNLNAAENLGLVGNMAYLQGKTDVNIKASGGKTNIGASGDVSIISIAGKMFAQGTSGIDILSGAAMKVQAADSRMDITATDMRLHGSNSLKATSSLIVMDSSGEMSAKGVSLYLEGTGSFDLKGGGSGYIGAGTVHINDIVQLASGAATAGAISVSGSLSLPAIGNEAQTKEEIQPAKFDDADAETPSGSAAGQAMPAEQPTGSQSKAADPSTPPDRHPPKPDKVTPIVVDGPTAFA